MAVSLCFDVSLDSVSASDAGPWFQRKRNFAADVTRVVFGAPMSGGA